MKTVFSAGALVSLVLLMACRARNDVQAPPREVVRFAEARLVNAAQQGSSAAYIGIVRGDVEVDLSFKVNGVLELIGPDASGDWKEGAKVKQGAVLARLKQADFVNAVNVAKARQDLARKQFERSEKLLQTGAVSPQEFDVVAAEKRSAEAALAQAEQALQDSTIFCPFEGTILSRFPNSGEAVAAGKRVLRIAKLDPMSVELGVPDKLLGDFQVGSNILVNISALEGAPPVAGVVSEVGVAGTVESRLFKVIIKVPNANGAIKSGMTASVPLRDIRPRQADAVLIPISALVAKSGGTISNELAVFVVEDQRKVREQAVKTGDLVGSSVVVNSGLKEGDKVVVVGAGALYDGALVEAREMTPLQRF